MSGLWRLEIPHPVRGVVREIFVELATGTVTIVFADPRLMTEVVDAERHMTILGGTGWLVQHLTIVMRPAGPGVIDVHETPPGLPPGGRT